MIYIILFIFGAAVGSFINVVALRYGTALSFIKGSSVCPNCGRRLKWRELIPVVSYLRLKGRCSGCRAKFSIQYLLVELASGFLAVFLYLKLLAFSFELLALFIIFEILILIFLYDLRHKIIPDFFVILFILFSFLYSFLFSNLATNYFLLAAILIPLPFALIWLLSRGRLMGLGDAKLMVGMGLLLGPMQGVSAVFLSFWLGAGLVLILYLYKKIFKTRYNSFMKLGMKSEIPFAPFLVLGTVLAFFLEINLFNI